MTGHRLQSRHAIDVGDKRREIETVDGEREG